MLVSNQYRLSRTQATLDFVDVDVFNDLPVFVDPRALRLLKSEWGANCTALVKHFFRAVLEYIRNGDTESALTMLSQLREPRETRLGLSRKGNRGRAVGSTLATEVSQALSKSKAIETGLLQDLEDTILMVDGISHDIVSDITTNIIRRPLIEYTQRMCAYYQIPLLSQVDSGPLWDPESSEWYNEYVSLPAVDNHKLLLVPKAIVRRTMEYDVEEYHNDYILEHLRQVELANPQSSLVKLLKTRDERRVTDKDLVEKYGRGKGMILDLTIKSPEILEAYRRDKESDPRPPLSNEALLDVERGQPIDWDALFNAIRVIPGGRDDSASYETAVESFLTALFYSYLTNPVPQFRIHEGRKRIDIAYTNCATSGFFRWASIHYECPLVFVECKNYSGEVGNPELDQLSGRFSPKRGRVGILVVRSFDDKAGFMKRCKDTARDDRGFIIPLDDGDLYELNEARRASANGDFILLQRRFAELIS
jgi:hypothetical protein